MDAMAYKASKEHADDTRAMIGAFTDMHWVETPQKILNNIEEYLAKDLQAYSGELVDPQILEIINKLESTSMLYDYVNDIRGVEDVESTLGEILTEVNAMEKTLASLDVEIVRNGKA